MKQLSLTETCTCEHGRERHKGGRGRCAVLVGTGQVADPRRFCPCEWFRLAAEKAGEGSSP